MTRASLSETLLAISQHSRGLSDALDDLHALIKEGRADVTHLPVTQRLLVSLSHLVTEAAAHLYGPLDQAERERRIAEAEAKP